MIMWAPVSWYPSTLQKPLTRWSGPTFGRPFKAFGFGLKFISWIQLLYVEPVAQVRVNNSISKPFKLYRGTRQGCPLSHLFFALTIEPLAIAICSANNITGLKYKTCEESIALYADDILLFLADPGLSLQSALSIIQEFVKYPSLKINWDKSLIYYK